MQRRLASLFPVLLVALAIGGLALHVALDEQRLRPGSIVTIEGDGREFKVLEWESGPHCWAMRCTDPKAPGPVQLVESRRITSVVGWQAVTVSDFLLPATSPADTSR